MFRKLFINVFFEKKRMLISIICIITVLLSYVGIQIADYSSQASGLLSPDFLVYGKGDTYGSKGYELFNDIDGLKDEVKAVLGDNSKVYGMVVRNILTKSREGFFQKIDYWVYGLDDLYFDDIIKGNLKEGRLPSKGKDEAVIGVYAANYFKLKVGDKINIPITLNREMDDSEVKKYVVTGIINENIDFLKSGIFISKNTFESRYGAIKENAVIGYLKNSKAMEVYKNSNKELNNLYSKYDTGSVTENFSNKSAVKRNIILNIASACLISSIVLFMVVLYLIKGIKKKIGLLKALGISDRYILKVIMGGLSIMLTISAILSILIVHGVTIYLNKSASFFIGFDIHVISLNSLVVEIEMLIAIIQLIAMYVFVKSISSQISPIDSINKL